MLFCRYCQILFEQFLSKTEQKRTAQFFQVNELCSRFKNPSRICAQFSLRTSSTRNESVKCHAVVVFFAVLKLLKNL